MRYFWLLYLLLFLGGCSGDCEGDQFREQLSIEIKGNDLFLEHSTNYFCCGDIRVKLEESGSDLILFEKDIGEQCMCTCGYKINTTLLNLPNGNHSLVLYGIGDEGEPSYTFRFKVPSDTLEILG